MSPPDPNFTPSHFATGQGGYSNEPAANGGAPGFPGGGSGFYQTPAAPSNGFGAPNGGVGGGMGGGMGGGGGVGGGAVGGGIGGGAGDGGALLNQMAGSLGGAAPLAQMGMAMGRDYVQNNVGSWISWGLLKGYFNVSNTYVVSKLKLLLFPLRHKAWARKVDGAGAFLSPRDDVNAPDLYIPLMAFVTYVLVLGFLSGYRGDFQPDQLGMTASSGLGAVLLEVGLVKAGFYLLSTRSVAWLDLTAYAGYKYVGIVLATLIGFLFGKGVYYGAICILGGFMSVFMINTLRLVILTPDSLGGGGGSPAPSGGHSRHYFLLFIAALQIPLCLYLGVGHWLGDDGTARQPVIPPEVTIE